MSKYKAAIIGLGNIGMEYDVTSSAPPQSHTLAYVLDEGFELSCAMDVQPEKAVTLHRFSPTTAFYADMREMFKEHPDVDIVSICTPPRFHLQNMQYVVRQTAVPYIFCEKPLILSLDELGMFKSLLDFRSVTIIPNLSRRWSPGVQKMREKIVSRSLGTLQKVLVRYTRGIYNTGAHLFDLLHWCGVRILEVQVCDKVFTTAEREGENTFSFTFQGSNGVRGYAEAFDDSQYYCFDVDFYFSNGKIEFRYNGNEIVYYSVGRHHLFPQFPELTPEAHDCGVLSDSCLAHAMKNWKEVIDKTASPRCSWKDAVYPLYVARALERSYGSGCSARVDWDELHSGEKDDSR